MLQDKVLYLGIRHHGPGSAASVSRALETYRPDKVLVEGPVEAESLLKMVGNVGLKPPVAQLIYAPDDHRDSVFFPFAEFSPEWQAILTAQRDGLPLEFFDLPQTHSIALARRAREEMEARWRAEAERDTAVDDEEDSRDEDREAPPQEQESDSEEELLDSLKLDFDPLDLLAEVAGYDDGESWWEQMVEEHQQDEKVFAAIADAMTAVRDQVENQRRLSERERLREAWMRKRVRQAKSDGFERIAVICGAWHVPALLRKVPVKDDNALLKGLPKVKVKATWIPWTYSRISRRSGYGAGVAAPGWYDFLWRHWQQGAGSLASGWLTLAARTLRREGIDVAPASVIEAVRLADSLAILRERPQPGLRDMQEAIRTTYGMGEETLLALLEATLLVGERLGEVPEDMPKTPLQEDFEACCKRLRLKREAVEKIVDLDLRKDSGRERSALFHRLDILDIPWAKATYSSGKGTFKESWQLKWDPALELKLIEHSIWGTTVAMAAGAFALSQLRETERVALLTEWLDRLLLADLRDAAQEAIKVLKAQAALASHVSELMQALPGLVQIIRYGDVRNTHSATLERLLDGFMVRINAGLTTQCQQLDEEAAREMADTMTGADSALRLLDNNQHIDDWQAVLQRMAELDTLPGVIVGRCYRLLENANVVDSGAVSTALSQALSKAMDPQQTAAWLEGLLAGSGLMLLHDDGLWEVLDEYLCQLHPERFEELTPLLRRTFATFAFGERRGLLRKADADGPAAAAQEDEPGFDHERAAKVLPLLDQILG